MYKIQTTLLMILFLTCGHALAVNIQVEFNQLNGELLKNVQAHSSILKASKTEDNLNVARIQQLHKQTPEEIKKALRPFGYYAVGIQKQLSKTASGFLAKYDVAIGNPILIHNVDVKIFGQGENDSDLLKLVKNFPLKNGSTLSHKIYENAKEDIIKLALSKGYLRAKYVVRELKVDLEKYFSEIVLHLDTGPQFLFGTTRFIQEGEQLDESFLYRYLKFKPNEPFNTAALLDLQTALSDSDHFSRIEIHQQFDKEQSLKVPLEINLTPRKPRRYRFGLGYGTDTGARASVEHQRRVSPKGHILTLKAKTSERINRVDMQYSMPLKNPATDQLAMNTHYMRQKTESRQSNAGALDLRYIKGYRTWRQAFAITYEQEDYQIADEAGSSQLLMPNMEWIYNKFNDRIYPTKGLRLTGELWLSHKTWRSDVDFLQLGLTGKWIYSPVKSGRIILKLLGGGTLVENINSLPASKRFYAGGDQTIRGYAYEELGPVDNNGVIIGGKYLAVSGIEYEHRLFTNWGGAIFFDAGNSFNDFTEPTYRGAGLGMRWRSKVGPIRIDFAWPLDKKVDYPRLHLIIGLDL